MRRLDYKEIINPFILLPSIALVVSLLEFNLKNILIYSFIIFLIISITNNIVLIILKIVRKRLYMFVYAAFLFHLPILILVFHLAGSTQPIFYSFLVLGVTDFMIQAFYNITQRKDGGELIKIWKDRLLASERYWFHPIAMQKYRFKDFTVSITDSEAINPTNLHINHLRPLHYEQIPKHIYKHQYSGKSYLFHLYLDNRKDQISTKDKLNFYGNRTIKGLKMNPELLDQLKKIDADVAQHILMAYKQGSNTSKTSITNIFIKNETAYAQGSSNIKVIIKKNYVQNNPEKIYSFLKKVQNFFNSKT